MAPRTWFPEVLAGSGVVLRRHVPGNLEAFRRWYSDPEIARLARYQEAPMRPDEVERFFTARVVGTDALAMAIHERSSGRLIGTCAFSQLDGENGSALYHITIGEKDAWGHGHGTEATQLMLDHAFGSLGLHRIALFVFEFNERAIRAYRRCGFVVEGRSRESIWRDGRWWDELAMSVLESDWRRLRPAADGDAARRVAEPAGADVTEPVGAGVADEVPAGDVAAADIVVAGGTTTGLLRRTIRRWR
jgi:RimJ/RimL family protein N-acetyltransferase